MPPCPDKARVITPTIRTTFYMTGCIAATYLDVREYADPNDAPIYARMRPAGAGGRGRWSRRWRGEILLQAFEATENAALATLLESLDAHQLPYDAETARAVLLALANATERTPWEERPMGARPHKPRRARHTWRDATGKRVHVYKDTLKPHVDPNCPCEKCAAIDAAMRKP